MTTQTPEISIVLVTDRLETVRKTLAYFRAQEGHERMEIVLIAPARQEVDESAGELRGFGHVQIVEVDSVLKPPLVRAEGIRAASAPIVLFAETHAYPQPGYVKALVRAHQSGPWAAVGPAVGNANPETTLSWANLFLDYGPWIEATRAGVTEDVPGHNAAYKRDVLLAFGDRLPLELRADHLMHAKLRAQGKELYLEPQAKVDHTNVSHPWWTVVERFQSARNFAGLRRGGWSPSRRLVYVCGSPLIPLVRFRRIVRDIRRSGRDELLPRLIPALLFCLTVSAAGEFTGYLRGPGRNPTLYDIEVHRLRYTVRSDTVRDADEERWLG